MSTTNVSLSDAIRDVRTELLAAREAGEDEDLKFRMGDVTLEFQVEVTRDGSAEAGVKFWVVNIGAKAGVSSTNTNTVTITLVPQLKGPDGEWQDAVIGKSQSGRPPLS